MYLLEYIFICGRFVFTRIRFYAIITPKEVCILAISMTKVRLLMDERGLKKIDLRKMGFSPNVVDKVLSGPLTKSKRVDTETINRLCEVLECQPGDIMEYTPDEK